MLTVDQSSKDKTREVIVDRPFYVVVGGKKEIVGKGKKITLPASDAAGAVSANKAHYPESKKEESGEVKGGENLTKGK